MDGRARRSMIAVTVIVACVGCASSGSGVGGGNSNVLTYDDMIATGENDLLQVIQRLRPRWLRPRGQSSFSATSVVTLFVDGSPRGDVRSLNGMLVTDVADVTYLTATEAAFRFGTLAGSGGTIAVRTSR